MSDEHSTGSNGVSLVAPASPSSSSDALKELIESIRLCEGRLPGDHYSKLASQFQKFSSNFSILQKAFIDERTKVQNVEKELKQRDQALRKLEQDMDSLDFRNISLSKRIEVLQHDLDGNATKPRGFFNFSGEGHSSTKHRSHSNASNSSGQGFSPAISHENELFEDLNQELKNKMIENEQLRSSIVTLESKLAEQAAMSAGSLKRLQSETDKEIDHLKTEVRKLTNVLTKVKQEKTDLETTVNRMESKAREKESNLMKQIADLNEQLRMKVCETLSPAGSSHSLSDQGIARSGSFSGNVHNRLIPGLPPRSGSLSIQNRTKRSKPSIDEKKKTMSCVPSHSSASYKDDDLRNEVINQFSGKLCELFCALSTVNSHFCKKISYLFALLNNGEYHFYFDASNPAISIENTDVLRQLSQTLQAGCDSHLVQLEESTKEYIKYWKKTFYEMDSDQAADSAENLKTYANEIVQGFSDYEDYLKKVRPLAMMCLNNWSKTLKSFNSSVRDERMPESLFQKLCNNEKRFDLIQRHENLIQDFQDIVNTLSHVYGCVKLLLVRSLSSDRVLKTFNQCLQRVNQLERFHESFKQNLAEKYGLEHELTITSRANFLENDDCFLSAVAFLKTIITDIRVLMEVHYFFFVCPIKPNQPSPTTTVNRIPAPIVSKQGRFIPEQEDLPEGDEEESKNLANEVDILMEEREKFTIELEHKTLLLEREAARISELELKVQDLMSQLEQRKENKAKLNDQLSSASSASISASNMSDCFGVQYPIQESSESPPSLGTILSQLKLDDDPDKDQFWRDQFVRIVNSLEESCAKLSASELECASLRQLYNQLNATNAKLEDSLKSNTVKLTDTQEEFETSVKNYQAQLQALTEHLAIQKETIEAQREQIDGRRYDFNPQHSNSSSPKTATSASSFVSKAFAGFKKA